MITKTTAFKRILVLVLALFCLCSVLSGCSISIENDSYNNASTSDSNTSNNSSTKNEVDKSPLETFDIASIPEYTDSPYVVINDNNPFFNTADYSQSSFEEYSNLDSLGRCGAAISSIGIDLMPTEERGEIGQVKPSGWQTVKYDIVDGKYLYNRCHLIGFQLTGENANEKNLITGTRYMNVQGMLPFENMVADYVKETENHVLYRVTPIFIDDNLVAHGVLMEAKSLEDNGDGICFNIFCYNVQPRITIDYATGNSELAPIQNTNTTEAKEGTYILNTNSKKIHLPSCSGVQTMSEKNKETYTGNINDLINNGYTPCSICNPQY